MAMGGKMYGIAVVAALAAGAVPAAETPSEVFVREARCLYATPEYASCTNNLVERHARRFKKMPPHAGECGLGWRHVPSLWNVRDIGGWNGLKTGVVFRGSQLFTNETGGVSQATKNALARLGIKTAIDLRTASEVALPDTLPLDRAGLVRIHRPIVQYMRAFEGSGTNAMRRVLLEFTKAENYPIYFHCKAGADRTGTLAFILEGLCGVSETDLAIDYELTSFAGRFGVRTRDCRWLNKRYRDAWRNMIALVKSYPGDALKDKFAAMAKDRFGLSDGHVAFIRSRLCRSDGERVVARGENGAYSPDGQRIAFQRHNGRDFDIGVFDRESGAMEWVDSGPGEAVFPSWSPEGAMVYSCCNVTQSAYRAARCKSSNGFNIWLFDGGRSRPLTKGRVIDTTPSFSPDGRTVYFAATRAEVDDKSQLWSVAMDDPGSVKMLRHPGAGSYNCGVAQPRVSPDGRFLVWAEFADFLDVWHLCAAKRDAPEDAVVVTPAGMVAYAPCWHPGGRHIAFTGFREGDSGWGIYLMDVKSGRLARLCDGKNPDVSPDGRRILYDDGEWIMERPLDADAFIAANAPPMASASAADDEKVLLSVGGDAATGAMPADAVFGAARTFFVRCVVDWDGDDTCYQRLFEGGWESSPIGAQVYFTKGGIPHFATRTASNGSFSVSHGSMAPKENPVTVTGIRTADAIFVSVNGGAPVMRRATMGLMALDKPARYKTSVRVNKDTHLRSVEFGSGWPRNVPRAKTVADLFR